MSGLSIAKSLEALLLRPAVTRTDVRDGAQLARARHLAAVGVFGVHVASTASVLAGGDTRTVAAVGFPYGQESIAARLAAVAQARIDGADEVAVMLDHSLLAAGQVDAARRELATVLEQASYGSLTTSRGNGNLTIVVETTLLELARIEPLLADLHDSPAGFVQTGAGWQPRAVTEDDVRRLRERLPADIAIKAVGGIATLDEAHELINAGATRIGSGSAVAIAEEERARRAQARSSNP